MRPLPLAIRSLLLPCLLLAATASPSQAQSRTVSVNGARVDSQTLGALEARYGVRVQDGAYWYDRASGAWGFDGGPTVSLIPAGLPLGGRLRANASRGRTGVWVNGRRLPSRDLRALEALAGTIQPGRYWLDGRGVAGREGGPALVDLAQLARRSRSSGSRSWITGIGSGSSGGSGYVIGRDWSVSY